MRSVLKEHGAVSEPVARAMAEGALAQSQADVAVSITGFAGRYDPAFSRALAARTIQPRKLVPRTSRPALWITPEPTRRAAKVER